MLRFGDIGCRMIASSEWRQDAMRQRRLLNNQYLRNEASDRKMAKDFSS